MRASAWDSEPVSLMVGLGWMGAGGCVGSYCEAYAPFLKEGGRSLALFSGPLELGVLRPTAPVPRLVTGGGEARPGVRRPQAPGARGCHVFGGRRGVWAPHPGLTCGVTYPTPSLGSSGFMRVVGREPLGDGAGGAWILEVFVQGFTSRMAVLMYGAPFLAHRGRGLSPGR